MLAMCVPLHHCKGGGFYSSQRERERERERERGVWKKYTIHLPGSLLYFPIKLTVIRACELLILVLVELKKKEYTSSII